MAKCRIKAYFMHEHEHAAAQEAVNTGVVTEVEWTPSFVMGVVDENRVKSLTEKGLVVSVVEEVVPAGDADLPKADARVLLARSAPRPAAFGFAESPARMIGRPKGRSLPVTIEGGGPKTKILSSDRRRPQFYVVRFHGPITEQRRKDLGKLRVTLLERLTRNKYTVKLKPSEVEPLAALPFVDTLRLYTEADTLRVRAAADVALDAKTPATGSTGRRRKAVKKAKRAIKPLRKAGKPEETERIGLYTVRMHLAKDTAAVAKWLAGRKRKPLWARGDQFQVALAENSKILTDLAKRPEVAVVEQVESPRLYGERARILLGLAPKNSKLGLEGEGEIIGVADTGIDVTHVDLKNHIAGLSAWGRKNNVTDPEGHGTHVAGCAVGDGSASGGQIMGAAPRAKVFFQSILDDQGALGGLPDDIEELLKEAYDQGARIHNNSWGAFSFARYSSTSLGVDRFVAAHPDMLVVIAAGNDGIGVPREPGAKMSAKNGFIDWPCVAAPATAKNGLTVGASRNARDAGGYASLTWNEAWPERYPHPPISQERISGNDQCLAAFSSRGPCDDLRIKPDVVAPGTDIAAARSKDAPLYKFWGAYPKSKQYGYMGGTSMAAPYVAGCAALVREWYRKKRGWATPSAALLKATLINGTQRLTGQDATAELEGDPNFHQGFGRIDMSSTVPSPLAPKLKLAFVDNWKDGKQAFTKTGDGFRYRLKVGNALPLRFCLSWTDPAARGLQNSLILLVDNADQTKWVGNAQAAVLLNVAGGPRDPNNNVQVVRIEKPKPGDYTIAISASMLLVSPQPFALVVTGDLQSDLVPIPLT